MSNLAIIAFVASVLVVAVIGLIGVLVLRVRSLERDKRDSAELVADANAAVASVAVEVERANRLVERARGISRLNALSRTIIDRQARQNETSAVQRPTVVPSQRKKAVKGEDD